MKKILLLICLLLGWGNTSLAGDAREVLLKDGSVVRGEILGFDGDNYTLRSDSLGTVRIESSRIDSIRTPSSRNHRHSATSMSANDISNIPQALLNDQDVMSLVQTLQNDPQVRAILNDPQLMQAISAGDLDALMNDPKMQALMSNPTVKEIVSKTQP